MNETVMDIRSKTIIFHGSIHPERVDYSYPRKIITLVKNYSDPEGTKCIIQIKKSKILVKAKVGNIKDNLQTLRAYVHQAVSMFVNLYCFEKAYGYDLEITSALVVEDDEIVIFGVDEPIFGKNTPPSLPELDANMVNNEFLQFALEDFRSAMRNSGRTSAYCRRSIEAIANAFGEGKDKFSKMESTLNLDSKYIQKYKEEAHDLRHGKPQKKSVSWDERQEQLLIAWEVSRRYMWYLKLGSVSSLPISKFPIFKSMKTIFGSQRKKKK